MRVRGERVVRRLAEPLLTLATGLAAAIPVITATVKAIQAGWVPLADRGIIATRAHDALTSHMPLVGQYTLAGEVTGKVTHSLGPMLFWLLAIPAHAGSTVGMTLTMGTLNTLCIVGSVALARRRGGRVLMVMAALAIALMCQSLAAETFHDVWNPSAGLFPFTLLVFLCWSLACGEYRLAPLTVLVASFVVQTHLTYLPPTLALLAVGFGGLVSGWIARRRRGVGKAGAGVPPQAGADLPPQGGAGLPPQAEADLPPQAGADLPPQGGAGLPPQAGADLPPQAGADLPPQAGADLPPQGGAGLPPQAGADLPPQGGAGLPPQAGADLPPQTEADLPPQGGAGLPPQAEADLPPQAGADLPPQGGADLPPQGGAGLPPQAGADLPPQGGAGLPPQAGADLPPQTEADLPPQGGAGLPPQAEADLPPQGGAGLPPQAGADLPSPAEAGLPPRGGAAAPAQSEARASVEGEAGVPGTTGATIDPKATHPPRRSVLAWGLATVLVTACCWSATVAGQLSEHPGNLTLVAEAATRHKATLGSGVGWHAVVRAVGLVPWWLHTPASRWQRKYEVRSTPTTLATDSTVAMLAALTLLLLLALLRHRRDLAALALIALVLCPALGTVAAATPTPRLLSATLGYTMWWGSQVGLVVWLTLAWALWLALAWSARRAAGAMRRRHAGTPPSNRTSALAALLSVTLTLLGIGTVAAVGEAVAGAGKPDEHAILYRPVKAIDARLAELIPRGGSVLLEGNLDGATMPVKPAVRYYLVTRGTRVLAPGSSLRLGTWYELYNRPYREALYLSDVPQPPTKHLELVFHTGFREGSTPNTVYVWRSPNPGGDVALPYPEHRASMALPQPGR